MFSISCNPNSPRRDCYWHYNCFGHESLFFNCINCGMNLKIKQKQKYVYSKILYNQNEIKQFIYVCYMCGALYSGSIITKLSGKAEVPNSRNYERIYFDFDEVDNQIHKDLLDKYNRPMLTLTNNGDIGIVNTNIDDKLELIKGHAITPEDAIFGDMEVGVQPKHRNLNTNFPLPKKII